ncbi:MAG: hypothetical protein R3F59_11285 [Myxococcota bacterium]
MLGNCAEVLPELVRRGFRPDPRHRPDLGPRPAPRLRACRPVARRGRALRASDPQATSAGAKESMAAHVQAMVDLGAAGAYVFDYGNNLRAMAEDGGPS